MNKERRLMISKAVEMMREAADLLETAKGEEEDYLESMPEGIRAGDKGDAAEEAVNNLDSAFNDLETSIASAEEAMQ